MLCSVCYPLQDVFNSVFAAVYLTILSLVAMATHNITGTLVGGVGKITYSFIAVLVSISAVSKTKTPMLLSAHMMMSSSLFSLCR